MIAALAQRLPELSVSGVSAGLHVLLNLPAKVNDRQVEQNARRAGLALEALSRYTLTDRGPRGILLGYRRMHETAIPQAIPTLSQILEPIA
jgi:GntR family transcriptional regulator/MocR family aminotransferase